MEIKYGANCGVTMKRFVPCAIVRDGDDIRIDAAHPHAKELTEIAIDLTNNVRTLDADDGKGFALLARAETLAGKDAAAELQFAWLDFRKRQRKAAAEREARLWAAKWNLSDPDERPGADADFLRALHNATASPKTGDGLTAVFAYGYQQGRDDAAKASRKKVTV